MHAENRIDFVPSLLGVHLQQQTTLMNKHVDKERRGEMLAAQCANLVGEMGMGH